MYKTIVAAILAITTSTLFAAQAPPQTKKTQNTVKHAPVIIKSKDGKKEVITYVKKDKTEQVKEPQGLKAHIGIYK